MLKNSVITLLILGFFSACSTHQLIKDESAFIVMKTKEFKYADMGFISNARDLINVKIYGAGQPLLKFEINALNVCMSTFECMNKKAFNKRVLSENYPDKLLENIFRAEPIFQKEAYVKTKNGFQQSFKKEGAYDISYVVEGGERKFKDRLNHILIKIKEQK